MRQEGISAVRVRQLLERIGVLKNVCDLDVLVFFARHTRSLLTSEQVARFLGYELKEVAASIETFLSAGLLARTENRTRVAQLFVFTPAITNGGSLRSLLELASTREGRVVLMQDLGPARSGGGGPHAHLDSDRMVMGR